MSSQATWGIFPRHRDATLPSPKPQPSSKLKTKGIESPRQFFTRLKRTGVMGSSASKAVPKPARKFPTRPPGAGAHAPPRPARQTPQTSAPKASFVKNDGRSIDRPLRMVDVVLTLRTAIHADSVNPNADLTADFSNRLKQMGVAQPNPTFSPSSTAAPGPPTSRPVPGPNYPSPSSNTTLSVLEARRVLEQQADQELGNMGRSTDKGREFLDVATIRDILVLRDQGVDPATIESRLHLRQGVVRRLGPPLLVSATGGNAT